MDLEQSYRARFARSAALAEQAHLRFPGGVTHDGRAAAPFPLFIERAAGPFKYDADDNRLIDFWCGHGALLLGHGHPAIVAAVRDQLERGTHAGGESPLALRWAELVQTLIPGAERVRFTSSGTEATMLAMRLARAFSGRPVIVRLEGHFHGWHDSAAPGADPTDPGAGLTAALLASMLTLPADLDTIAATLATRSDLAAVIIEPTGAGYGTVPLPDSFLRELRALTTARDVLLICDEVVTGFRISPGGAQARAGISADLTCLAKILAGGLAGGAVVGREPILRRLAEGDSEAGARGRIRHQGTYNANPLAAAAGVACLELVADGTPGAQAAARGQELLAALNQVISARKVHGFTAYGDGSIIHLFADPALAVTPGQPPLHAPLARLKAGGDPTVTMALRMALQIVGVDFMRGRSAFVSSAHTSDEVAASAAALDDALAMLVAARVIKP
jgi:glutamate-1-semialdehyde 2,1-aminomutase